MIFKRLIGPNLEKETLNRLMEYKNDIDSLKESFPEEPRLFQVNNYYTKNGVKLSIDDILGIINGLLNKDINLLNTFNIDSSTFNSICNDLSDYFNKLHEWSSECAKIYYKITSIEKDIIYCLDGYSIKDIWI